MQQRFSDVYVQINRRLRHAAERPLPVPVPAADHDLV